jgi:ATP-dependent Clp protease ATP-binding subunit ClpC
MVDDILLKLTTGAQRIVQDAQRRKEEAKHTQLGINHWVLALLERFGPMCESILPGFDSINTLKQTRETVASGEAGPEFTLEEAISLAEKEAQQRGKTQATERDLSLVILQRAGYSAQNGVPLSGSAAASTPTGKPSTSSSLPTPTLDQFALDLTRAARDGKLSPMIGRQEELSLLTEILCRRTKRNPVLVGPAGVGKTAIVEGFAQAVVQGSVPAMLANVRVYSLQPSNLEAGASMAGEMEKRVQAIIKEASQPSIILFIDEIHTIMGAGGSVGTTDMAAMLKPALSRGDLACIAATTDDEYRRFIEQDTALERRFQPVRVHEMTADQALQVLDKLQKSLTDKYQINLEEGVLRWLVNFADQYMRNRHFPDKAVDLLEQSYAHAAAHSQSLVALADAQAVAQRMIGMPVSLQQRIQSLRQELQDKGLLAEEEVNILVQRLQVTTRGLDLRATRPNAVFALSGRASDISQSLAETLAGTLFGSIDRVIAIDFSRFVDESDINKLIGSPPGYVGYSDSLPIHRLIQIPWSVCRFDNVDYAHPQIRTILAQAIKDGFIVDGRGRTIYLSDTIILLGTNANINLRQPHRSLGFQTRENSQTEDPGALIFNEFAHALTPELAVLVDVFVTGLKPVQAVSSDWLKNNLLDDLSERYSKQGLNLTWDPSLTNWLVSHQEKFANDYDWEKWVDHDLGPLIIPYIPETGVKDPVTINVLVEQDQITIHKH